MTEGEVYRRQFQRLDSAAKGLFVGGGGLEGAWATIWDMRMDLGNEFGHPAGTVMLGLKTLLEDIEQRIAVERRDSGDDNRHMGHVCSGMSSEDTLFELLRIVYLRDEARVIMEEYNATHSEGADGEFAALNARMTEIEDINARSYLAELDARISDAEERLDAKEQRLTKVETRIPLTVGKRLVDLEDRLEKLEQMERDG